MPEESNGRKIYSLYELARSIQMTIASTYPHSYWIKAEMNKLNYYRHSGHCYPDLVEKKDGRIIAQMRATLWKEDYQSINSAFLNVLNEPLKDGIKILFLANLGFHPEYGFSLRIIDIDPFYTLGDLEKEKQDTIKRLKEEGLFHRNKNMKVPLLPQRVAVISVETSKGFADFLNTIREAERLYGYKIFHMLFPSLLQGEKAVESILKQLGRIKKVQGHFDVVVIVRGGGGEIGLSCYNDYTLAREIALFPLPVITGIGHATNETVAEMVACENAITPTKLAEWLVHRFHEFADVVENARRKIVDKTYSALSVHNSHIQGIIKLFRAMVSHLIMRSNDFLEKTTKKMINSTLSLCSQHRQALSRYAIVLHKDSSYQLRQSDVSVVQLARRMSMSINVMFRHHQSGLGNLEQRLQNVSPANVLKRGFSITRINGKAICSAGEIKERDTIDTVLHQGSIRSNVISISKKSEI